MRDLGWPLPPECNRITQRFAERPTFNPDYYSQWGYPGHPAIDIACDIGTETYATHDGWTEPKWHAALGNYIKVYTHDGVLMTRHSHLSKIEVTFGQHVRRGECIGLTGATGMVTGPHLDFAVKEAGVTNAAFKNWLDPLAYLRRSIVNTKTSLHWQTLLGWSRQVMADWRPVWVKLMDPPTTRIDPFPDVQRKAIRFHTDGWDDDFVASGAEGGRDYIQRLLPQILVCPWADGVEVTNERGCNDEPGISNLRDFSIGAMRELSKHGKRGIIYNWPEASPHNNDLPGLEHTIWKMNLFLPAVIEAVETGHIIGRHCYWRPEVEGPLGRHHALGRLEWDVLWWGEQGVDISKLQVLVTEWGIDGGIAHKPAVQGWQDMVAQGLTTRDRYIAQIVEGERRAQQLPWLLGLFLFNAGSVDPWRRYDHDERMARDIIGALRSVQPAPPPGILPESETATDAATLVEKCRWWHEAYVREVEAGNLERARDIRYSLVHLMYRAEEATKQGSGIAPSDR